jgi:hypothetical protein
MVLLHQSISRFLSLFLIIISGLFAKTSHYHYYYYYYYYCYYYYYVAVSVTGHLTVDSTHQNKELN